MTLLETLGALLIGLIVLGGSGYMISKGIDNDKIAKAEQNLSTFRLDIKNLYQGEPDFNGLTTDIAVTNEAVPDGMIKSSGEVRNVWNGAVTVAAGTDPTTFTITHNSVPEYACVKLATFQAGSWVSVTVNGVVIQQASGMVAAITNQLATTNTIVFTSN
ncbi:type 4 pilus major pilin [Desulfovibrio sp. JC022]|uniref:type 4 pilus major pilin n=1 Tax=Desulfovibrio sp. JC022 TaxID=2593642 RepID=UPI0013D2693C|nr:type 4 pilus major pilin [Desulfovibrio sp. JC022]NDV23128.1 pilus assembly protein PilS [Desulfovibrio sp. JC022]